MNINTRRICFENRKSSVMKKLINGIGAATTLGRKIIRNLCGLKGFSDINYN
ncbi:hypothetical protein ACQPUY_04535 [Clostridium nigeriense]